MPKKTETREVLRGERSFHFERSSIDQEARTVELSFSSEDPYERWWGVEILGHKDGECDLSWMQSGNAPFLCDHNTKDIVGIIEKASVGADRKGRAIVRFGKSARASEVFQDVLDGIRRNVSVGYEIRKMLLIEETDDISTYRVVDWFPLEASLVGVPADMTVGIGKSRAEAAVWLRSHDVKLEIPEKEKSAMTTTTDTKPKTVEEVQAEIDAGIKKDRERTREIRALGRRLNMADEAERACESNMTLDQFRALALEKLPPANPLSPTLPSPTVITDSAGFKNVGDQLIAVRNAKLRPHMVDKRLVEARALGANEATPEDGGFLVQQDFAQEIIKRINDIGQVQSRVRRIPISGSANGTKIPAINETSRATGSRWGGVQAYWIQEGGALTPSRPKFRMINLNLGKLAALMYATDEILQDAAQLEAIANEAFPEELNFMLEDAIINGDGTGKPLGFLNGNSVVNVAIEGTQTIANTAGFLAINVANMMARMPARNYANAVWLVNPVLLAKLVVMTIGGAGGATPVYLPGGNLSGTPFGTLLGRPVIPVEYCAAEGTPGDIILADLSQYVVADKGGIDYASSMHVAFLTDEMAFRFILRVDGQPVWNNVLTPFKGSATQAPFVTLATRS